MRLRYAGTLRGALVADLSASVPMDEAQRLPTDPTETGNRLFRKGCELATATGAQSGVDRRRSPRLEGVSTVVSGEIAQRLALDLATFRTSASRKCRRLTAAAFTQSGETIRVSHLLENAQTAGEVAHAQRAIIADAQPASRVAGVFP